MHGLGGDGHPHRLSGGANDRLAHLAAEVLLVDLAQTLVDFTREDALVTEVGERDVETTEPRKEVDEP